MAKEWWHTALTEPGRQIFEWEASLVYRASSRIVKATQRNPVLKNQNTKQNKQRQNQKPERQWRFGVLFVFVLRRVSRAELRQGKTFPLLPDLGRYLQESHLFRT